MVLVGLTDRVPEALTVPIVWSIEMVVASVVLQVKVEAAPLVIDAGLAVRVAVGSGSGAAVTVIAPAVLVPAGIAWPAASV